MVGLWWEFGIACESVDPLETLAAFSAVSCLPEFPPAVAVKVAGIDYSDPLDLISCVCWAAGIGAVVHAEINF